MDAIHRFLPCDTPSSWLEAALANQPNLLIDHANCEKKAAATAINLMHRYSLEPGLLSKMSQLAREELLHFHQVVKIMADRGIRYRINFFGFTVGLRSLISISKYTSYKVSVLGICSHYHVRICKTE